MNKLSGIIRQSSRRLDKNLPTFLTSGVSHYLNPVRERHGYSPKSTSFRKPPGVLRLILWNLCENTVCSLLRFCPALLYYCSSRIVHASRVERGVLFTCPSDSVARAITRVTDDYERSIFKALFLLELNHSIDDELEDGYPFVTDVVDCVRTSRREILDTLRLCS